MLRAAGATLLLLVGCRSAETECPEIAGPVAPHRSNTSAFDETGGLRLTYSVQGADGDASQRVAEAFHERAEEHGVTARVYRLDAYDVVVEVGPGVNAKLLRRLLEGNGEQDGVRLEAESLFGPVVPIVQ